jgi:hypothetical protein
MYLVPRPKIVGDEEQQKSDTKDGIQILMVGDGSKRRPACRGIHKRNGCDQNEALVRYGIRAVILREKNQSREHDHIGHWDYIERFRVKGWNR